MPAHPATTEAPAKRGWFQRLRDGLSRSSSKIATGIGDIFTKRKLDDAALRELEELLISADLGPATAARLTANLAKTKFNQEVSADEIRGALAKDIADILKPIAKPLAPSAQHKPHVILVVGVNGTGKTTTIGKLAARLREDGKRVMLAAGDTFRAAAIDQLKIWGERTGATVIAREPGSDPAANATDQRVALLLRVAPVALHDHVNPGADLPGLIQIQRLDGHRLRQHCHVLPDAAQHETHFAELADVFETAEVSALDVGIL